MDLFLTINLPKVEDIAHVPPPFPECDNWLLHTEQTRMHMSTTQHYDLGKTTENQ